MKNLSTKIDDQNESKILIGIWHLKERRDEEKMQIDLVFNIWILCASFRFCFRYICVCVCGVRACVE